MKNSRWALLIQIYSVPLNKQIKSKKNNNKKKKATDLALPGLSFLGSALATPRPWLGTTSVCLTRGSAVAVPLPVLPLYVLPMALPWLGGSLLAAPWVRLASGGLALHLCYPLA